ncbi:hypothetical protein ACFO8O_12040 [Hephaestia sp. GCM10023244]|uniref:hypothetical protein n=1 Tax=unclassified Hephaestia TaxID=2631281 RepID=UPI00207717EA|nr:hypothetical protein [Hephaestia sp. MAHUQ-44]MCM8731689.1 hypothetical protein [Hephaestia sp. MAHUQ-44]
MSGVDRATAQSTHPGVSFFGGEAAAKGAFSALVQGDPQTALVDAKRAVRAAPVDPSTTSALGSALLALGRDDEAHAAFTVAGTLGWRDVPTQFYWLAQAGAVGDVGVVAQRLDALLRLNITNEAVANALYGLGQTSLGQQALAMLLVKNPPWEARFVAEISDLEEADFAGRMTAIDLAATQGATFDCETVGIVAGRLVRSGNAPAGKNLWQITCDRTGGGLLSDGDFEGDPSIASSSPFTWQMRSEGGLDAAVQPAPAPLSGHALRIQSSKTARIDAASQLTTLGPGRYRLSWIAADEGGGPGSSVTVSVRCEGAGELTDTYVRASAVEGNRVATTFTVPSEGCPVQTIAIQKAASGLGETQTGWIDEITLSPISAQIAAQRS